ncbi:ankyrin repeat-containing domain protein [Annulohypoxylon nitens]|nr:ankyrin repeat-containing domain protein [Annulohypoxylon nitens]
MINNDWGEHYDLDKKDVAHGKTILHWAAEFGFTDLIQELISANANISIQDVYGETPLHYAAESGHMRAVEILVDAGASLTITDFRCRNFRTPRDCALQRFQYKVAEYLSGLMDAASPSTDGQHMNLEGGEYLNDAMPVTTACILRE